MRIQNNVTAQNSHRNYNINVGSLGKNMEKLSSGYRVNRAADDAAGLAISEKMRTQIRGLSMASRNAQDGVSLVQTAEGALQTAHAIMQRMRELAVQAANGTNQDFDRSALDLEFKQLNSELAQIEDTVKFNDMSLFKGVAVKDGNTAGAIPATSGVGYVFSGIFTLQTGANEGDYTVFKIGNFREVPDTISTRMLASQSIGMLDKSINTLSITRAQLGAIQNRLEYKIQNLDNSVENLQAAESRIRDADMAKMMTEFTKNNILFQASTAMLAQANALPQGVLQLLG